MNRLQNDPGRFGDVDLSDYLKEYYRLKHSLKTVNPWPSHPDRSVLYRPLDGRWYAAVFRISGKEIGMDPHKMYQVMEIPFDPDLIAMLEDFSYCARACFMDSKTWLMLVLQNSIPVSTYTALLEASWEYMKGNRQASGMQTAEYHDEPIMRRVVRSENVPPKITEMKNLYQPDYTRSGYQAEIFYRQAVFMADYRDAYDFRGTFHSARPIYHSMTDAQLRGYFTWRSDLMENGEIRENTPPAFLKLYVYELLHLVHGNARDTYEQLLAIEEGAVYSDQIFRMELKKMIDDFVIYYNPAPDAIRKRFHTADEDSVLPGDILIRPDLHTEEEITQALHRLSAAEMKSSSFLRDHEQEALRALYLSFMRMQEESVKTGRGCFEKILYFVSDRAYHIFSQAVFFERSPHEDCEYPIHEGLSYVCVNGRWRMRSYTPRTEWRLWIHELDRQLRQPLGYRRSLKAKPCPEEIRQAVSEAVKEYLIERKEALRPKIEIDMSALGTIRSDAAETRESLIVEEEEEDIDIFEEAAEPEAAAEPVPEETEDSIFTPEEAYLIRCLLDGADPGRYLNEHHLSVFILADSVNEKMMDELGDTAIEFDGDQPVIIEDYRDDLDALVNGR